MGVACLEKEVTIELVDKMGDYRVPWLNGR